MIDFILSFIAMVALVWSVAGCLDWLIYRNRGGFICWLDLLLFGPLVWALLANTRLTRWRSRILKRYVGTDQCRCDCHRH